MIIRGFKMTTHDDLLWKTNYIKGGKYGCKI